MALKNLFTGQQRKNRHREYIYGHRERGGKGEMYRKNNMGTYISFLKIDFTMRICCMAQETQAGSLYQPRGEERGGRREGGSKERGYMCTYG